LVAEIPSGKGAAEVEQALTTVGQTAFYLAAAGRGLLTAGLALMLAFHWSLQGDRTIRCLLLLLDDRPRVFRAALALVVAVAATRLGADVMAIRLTDAAAAD
jgi:hypothetical protein